MLDTVFDQGGQWRHEAVLMLQDIVHRQWAFTRKAAARKHPDYNLYVACIADVFNQLRKPFNESVHGAQALSDKERDWRRHIGTDQTTVYRSIRTSILRGEDAVAVNDRSTCTAFRMLGNASMTTLEGAVGVYIPRRVLRTTARRMNLTLEEVDKLFPDHGYADGTDFLQHLRGCNAYFTEVRSPAAAVGDLHAVAVLGEYQGPRKPRGVGSQVRRVHANTRLSDALAEEEHPPTWEPIGANPLIEEGIRGCEDPVTLHGLMGHQLVTGLNTEEAIVEAVNRHMNVSTHQGCIGYDVATMRLHYLRLKWDSAAMQRIMYGDRSRRRRATTQAVAVWNMARAMLSNDGKGLAQCRRLSPISRTSPSDLLAMGYRLRQTSSEWADEDVKTFFDACVQVRRCPEIVQKNRTVHEWMARGPFKGRKSTAQIKEFAEVMYGHRKRKRRYHVQPGGPQAPTSVRNVLRRYENTDCEGEDKDSDAAVDPQGADKPEAEAHDDDNEMLFE